MPQLDQVAEEIRNCSLCRLAGGRTCAVPGEGPEDADIVFIGEAPGFHEDQQGRPFVGAAGQFLNQLLALAGLERGDIYITNVVKCRPPDNREPQPDEITACRPYLDRQLAIIKPKMVVTLGRFSMRIAFTGVTISRVHGQPKRIGDRIFVPMFHPAAALHQPRYRSMIEEDFTKIPTLLADLANVESASVDEPPEQLTLF